MELSYLFSLWTNHRTCISDELFAFLFFLNANNNNIHQCFLRLITVRFAPPLCSNVTYMMNIRALHICLKKPADIFTSQFFFILQKLSTLKCSGLLYSFCSLRLFHRLSTEAAHQLRNRGGRLVNKQQLPLHM